MGVHGNGSVQQRHLTYWLTKKQRAQARTRSSHSLKGLLPSDPILLSRPQFHGALLDNIMNDKEKAQECHGSQNVVKGASCTYDKVETMPGDSSRSLVKKRFLLCVLTSEPFWSAFLLHGTLCSSRKGTRLSLWELKLLAWHIAWHITEACVFVIIAIHEAAHSMSDGARGLFIRKLVVVYAKGVVPKETSECKASIIQH